MWKRVRNLLHLKYVKATTFPNCVIKSYIQLFTGY